jgi:hypothetical protein
MTDFNGNMNACLYAYMYVCMHACMHVRTYVRTCSVALGGLVVIVLAIGPKVCGLKPGRGQWIFKGDMLIFLIYSGVSVVVSRGPG